MIVGTCWRCETPGHVASECDRPPPKNRKELNDRIDRYKERWNAGYGVISTTQKRTWIAMEMKAFEKARAA